MSNQLLGSPTRDLISPSSSEPRLSLEDDPTPSVVVNGNVNGQKHGDGGDPMQMLREELERTKEEKDALAAQYRNLLGKLTTMRTTLQNKLKQDAEELDRREQLVQQLTAENEDLTSTVETLKSELISSNSEAEHASRELESMRHRALQETAQETTLRERELRELQSELERCRMERDEWENAAMQDRVIVDELKATAETLRRDLEIEREAREREAEELEMEREKSNNLQSVLEDFQNAKDHESRQSAKEYDTQFIQLTQALAEYKHRALTAELQLEESTSNSSQIQDLQQEVKEKNLLIGKLRHEGVIMNEHLMEALRRLRRQSSSENVDRRLVTNVLLSFLSTPRADSKRFEMLQLLASILSWSENEREKAGLQRTGPPTSNSSIWGRSASSTSLSSGTELEKSDETESFSRLWVEFLLTQAAAGQTPPSTSPSAQTPTRTNTSLPGSPTRSHHLSSGSPLSGARRLPSFASAAAMASSPNLTLPPPPSRKGKEKVFSPEP